MEITADLIRINDILVEMVNLQHEIKLINVRMFNVWKNESAMAPLLLKAKEVRLEIEKLEEELQILKPNEI